MTARELYLELGECCDQGWEDLEVGEFLSTDIESADFEFFPIRSLEKIDDKINLNL